MAYHHVHMSVSLLSTESNDRYCSRNFIIKRCYVNTERALPTKALLDVSYGILNWSNDFLLRFHAQSFKLLNEEMHDVGTWRKREMHAELCAEKSFVHTSTECLYR
jgi:hypothetical protein